MIFFLNLNIRQLKKLKSYLNKTLNIKKTLYFLYNGITLICLIKNIKHLKNIYIDS